MLDAPKPKDSASKLTILPLVALIFYSISGGPFSVEDSVAGGGGPLLALLGFIIFPLIWSIPEALITAQLAASFPSNGGYVLWISSAFGSFWGFQEGFWKWVSENMDNAMYPVMFLDYLQNLLSFLRDSFVRTLAFLTITACLTFINYHGLNIVGNSAVALTTFSLSPFVVMALVALPRIRPKRWLVIDVKKADFRKYFNTMFWNLNYWDKSSTIAGEVDDPRRSFPKALFGAVLLVMFSYLLPLLAGTGVLDENKSSEWTDGYFAQVGLVIGGRWLHWWIQLSAALSNMGLFEAEMSSDSFQLLGMSEIGMLPAFFATRSKYGTPTISILCSASGIVLLLWMSFQEILEFLNFLYAVGMVLEFAAFMKLRIRKPDLHRPFKVPVGTSGAVFLCVPPSILLIAVISLASTRTYIVGGGVVILGFFLHVVVEHLKNNKLVVFASSTNSLESDFQSLPIKSQEVIHEVYLSLLSESSEKNSQDHEISLKEEHRLL